MSRNRPRTLRVFLAAHGDGPWICEECGKIIHVLGRGRGEGCIHHRDKDEINDVPENLVALHGRCHRRLHENVEVRARITASLRGKPRSPETKAKISASLRAGFASGRPPVRAMLGRTMPPESIEKRRATIRSKRETNRA